MIRGEGWREGYGGRIVMGPVLSGEGQNGYVHMAVKKRALKNITTSFGADVAPQ